MSTELVVKAIALRDKNFARVLVWTQKPLSRIVADAARLVRLRRPALLGRVSRAIVLRAKSSATGNASIQKRRTHIVADAARLAAIQRPVRRVSALAPTDKPIAAALVSIQHPLPRIAVRVARLAASERPVRRASALAPTEKPIATGNASIQKRRWNIVADATRLALHPMSVSTVFVAKSLARRAYHFVAGSVRISPHLRPTVADVASLVRRPKSVLRVVVGFLHRSRRGFKSPACLVETPPVGASMPSANLATVIRRCEPNLTTSPSTSESGASRCPCLSEIPTPAWFWMTTPSNVGAGIAQANSATAVQVLSPQRPRQRP